MSAVPIGTQTNDQIVTGSLELRGSPISPLFSIFLSTFFWDAAAARNSQIYPGGRGGGEELPNVGYMGMCHLPGSIFHFQKSRTGSKFLNYFQEQAIIFKVLLQNRILFWQSGLKRQKSHLPSSKW